MTPRPQHPAPRRTRFAARWLASACLLALAGCALTPPEPEIAPRPGWQPPPVTFWRWGPPPPAPDRDVPPSYMVLLANADGSTGQVHMQGSQGRQVLDRARQGVDIAGPTTPFAVTEAQIQRDFGAALAARPTLPERFHVYFDSGKADTPTATSQDTLRSVVARAERFSHLEVRITGHADTRGDVAANRQLGLARARSVAAQLRRLGLRAKAVEINTAGEGLPQVPTADEVAEALNRRVEIVLR